MTIAEHLRNEGMQKGEHKKALAIAKNMLLENASLDFIKRVTGLSDLALSKILKHL